MVKSGPTHVAETRKAPMTLSLFPDFHFPEFHYPDFHIVNPGKAQVAECVDHLANLPMFATLSKRHLRAIARLTHEEQIEAGQNLITEGAAAGEAYVILAGSAVVSRSGSTVAQVGPGDVVGEMGMLLDQPRTATVHALTPLEYLVISRKVVQRCVAESPELAWLFLEAVAKHTNS